MEDPETPDSKRSSSQDKDEPDMSSSESSEELDFQPPPEPSSSSTIKANGEAPRRIAVRTDQEGPSKLDDSGKSFIDTRAPIASVKQAASKFGGITDWKAHKIKTVERRRHIEHELEKTQDEIPQYKKRSEEAEETKQRVQKELDTCKRLIEELKLNLERAQTEEQQANQDSELAKLRVQEMEQGIADEASVAAKTQLEVVRARHETAVSDLNNVKTEMEVLRKELDSLTIERDEAIRKAEEAGFACKEVEKTVEDLTIELITTKESLESAQSAHLEAEELRLNAEMAKEQDSNYWEKELKQAEMELKKMRQQVSSSKDLRLKLDTASTLLVDLKSELGAYMESKLKQETELSIGGIQVSELKTNSEILAAVASAKKELEEVKNNIEKAMAETDTLKSASSSLQEELDRERMSLNTMKNREKEAIVTVSALEAELERTRSDINVIQLKEKEIREKTLDMPMQLQQAAEESEVAKKRVQEAREELKTAKEEMDREKAGAGSVETRLLATQKEIEAARASEKLALAVVKALQESESARITSSESNSPSGITLSLEEYYELSRRAQEAEEQANARVDSAMSQIEVAKEAEARTVEKLEEVKKALALRKEALKAAQEKAEMARERKLGVEQELRKWRSEHEQKRNGGDDPQESPRRSLEDDQDSDEDDELGGNDESPNKNDNQNGTSLIGKAGKKKKKKKKSFLPKIFMFLGNKKKEKPGNDK